LRFGINRSLGWNRIRSDLYSVEITGNMLHFTGHGYGHGVGLCEAGAFEMAREQHTSSEILAFYFPNTRPGLTPSGELWHNESIGSITLRTLSLNAELSDAIEIAWKRALTLFPPPSEAPRPVITIAPTTELFRQITTSPGYLLAVTRGDQITLQPLSVLRRNGPIEPLILHEFLHVLIESQSTEKAPLWLREGLAEALADVRSPYTPASNSLVNIEQKLASPADLGAYRQAHRDAEAIVRTLGHTYSLTVMRRWLRDGVPEQVEQSLR
jgi:stage II sporulation protein D